ncbi:hypothetical protein [Treponema bryantii]|uniref:hypothetical protein n=1 Tax=Treponema bryantii TaxID=163 RepID=UPI0030C893C7
MLKQVQNIRRNHFSMTINYNENSATRAFNPASCEKAPSFLYFSIIYSAAEVVMKSNKTFKYVMYVTLVHCLTYFICGVFFSNVLRYSWWWQQPVVCDYFRDFGGTANALGPFVQIIRGLLFAFVLLPFREFFKGRKYGWLFMWLLFLGIGIIGPMSSAPSSIEGMVYSKLPLAFHFVGWPEIMIQTLLFCILVCRYINRIEEKKSIFQNPLLLGALLSIGAFFVYTIVSIIFAIVQKVEINTERAELKNMLQFFLPVILVFVMAIIQKPKLIFRTLILYAGSVLIFALYQGLVLKDMNLIYDFAAPVLPALVYYWVGLMREKSYLKSEKSDTIEE